MTGSDDYLSEARQARSEDRPDDAQRAFQAALAAARSEGLRPEVIEALKGIAQLKRDQGDPGGALTLYREAVALAREEDALQLAHTLRHLGDAHREAGHLEAASAAYDEALGIYRGEARAKPADVANAVRSLALLREAAGDVDGARQAWEEARDLYTRAGMEEGARECEDRLAALPGRS